MRKRRQQDWFSRLMDNLSWRSILFNPGILLIVATMILIAVATHLWQEHHAAFADLRPYQLHPNNVQVSLSPAAVQPLQDPAELLLDELNRTTKNSLLDPTLVPRTVEVFQRVGWVENVSRVQKSDSGLQVDLVMRTPVGQVELNRNTIPDWPLNQAEKLYLVDHQAIVLSDQLFSDQTLLRFTLFQPIRFTNLDEWSRWPDQRVVDCGSIAKLLQDRWQDFGFYRITTNRMPTEPDNRSIPYELWTDTTLATKVVWGNPPGQESEGEIDAPSKLSLLEELLAKYGPFNELPPTRIDIRSGTPVTSSTKVAERN